MSIDNHPLVKVVRKGRFGQVRNKRHHTGHKRRVISKA